MRLFTIGTLAAAMVCGASGRGEAQKNKVNCGPDVPVAVTIAGTPTNANGNALVSDGGGNYVNSPRGSDKITAIFQVTNCSFDFTMNLNFSRRSMWALLVDQATGSFVRRGNFFNFDRIGSVPITTGLDPLVSDFCQSGWARAADGSVPTNPDGTYRDNYGGCHIDEFGDVYILRGGGISLDPDERLGFARSPLDIQDYPCPGTDPVCQASYIRVYHPDATTWVLRPHGVAQAVYRVWNSGAYLYEGYQTLPFEITVTKP